MGERAQGRVSSGRNDNIPLSRLFFIKNNLLARDISAWQNIFLDIAFYKRRGITVPLIIINLSWYITGYGCHTQIIKRYLIAYSNEWPV